ncbi:MAG: DUF2156 domain-containing protein [Candidatus Manganitrophaceae bacterium]|nr:MAG: DUF2156 domain-containing protein [Candidatus Manganitrophaceae bacterium]
MIDLKPFELDARPLFDRYLQQTGAPLSAYSFPAHFLWRDHFSFHWAIHRDRFLLFAEYDRCLYMPLPPLGPADPAIVLECFAWMDRKNPDRSISRIESIAEAEIGLYQECGFTLEWKAPEYLYRRAALAELKGDRYKSPRAACNAFEKHHPIDRPYTASDAAAAQALLKRWMSDRAARHPDPIYRQMLCDSESVHRHALSEADPLGLIGRVVEVSGELAGYTFGFPLDRETFCILLEVADPKWKGGAASLFRSFCRSLDAFQWINAMDDSGIPSLRQTKESYRPERKIGCALARH